MQTGFPFQLEDIQSWIVRRKDGTVCKYTLVASGDVAKDSKPKKYTAPVYSSMRGGFSDWCDHAPWPEGLDNAPASAHVRPPVFTDGRVSIWQADAVGARKCFSGFDVCIDGGNVLDVPGERDLPDIYGDAGLVGGLTRYTHKALEVKAKVDPATKILKLHWFDRMAPPVVPAFWPALLEHLYALQKPLKRPLRVLTICQGGHGRSGTALVSLVLCMTKYSPLDAITHLRALHCARAIESKVQHEYINALGKYLGRVENALETEKVKSFKDRLLAEPVFDQSYKDQLNAGKGAGAAQRDGTFC